METINLKELAQQSKQSEMEIYQSIVSILRTQHLQITFSAEENPNGL